MPDNGAKRSFVVEHLVIRIGQMATPARNPYQQRAGRAQDAPDF